MCELGWVVSAAGTEEGTNMTEKGRKKETAPVCAGALACLLFVLTAL